MKKCDCIKYIKLEDIDRYCLQNRDAVRRMYGDCPAQGMSWTDDPPWRVCLCLSGAYGINHEIIAGGIAAAGEDLQKDGRL